jgi:poly(A)-specific ribonuclease
VIEALAGGDFADEIPAKLLQTRAESRVESSSQDMKRIEAILKKKQPIMIGHNQFFDLCFLYQTFIGSLPGTMDGFKREIHHLFPRLVDTKYLATRHNHRMHADDNLSELFDIMQKQSFPQIYPETGYGYVKESAHQAGYDSKFIVNSLSLSQDVYQLIL